MAQRASMAYRKLSARAFLRALVGLIVDNGEGLGLVGGSPGPGRGRQGRGSLRVRETDVKGAGMGRIAVLDPRVADRIAAGEVVERPASVVRELLDNALDAGARTVDIELEEGGRERVRVADDGEGMQRDDAVLAFERHATSKIRTGDDLLHVASLGFRGEALAAIAAVSRVTALTAPAEGQGTRVVLDHGRLLACEPAPRARGTTMDVRGLFAGIPARRKFLKTPATELDHCLRTVRRAALARPAVGFRVRHEGRVVLELAPGSDEARVRALLGDRWGRNLIPIRAEAGRMRVRGWVGRADLHRPTREGIQVVVNGRPVRDGFLIRAATDAFRNTLPPGRYPIAVILLEVPADEVDVNVHPAKAEVRCHRLREVRALVVGAVSDGLGVRAAVPHAPGGLVRPQGGAGGRLAAARPADVARTNWQTLWESPQGRQEAPAVEIDSPAPVEAGADVCPPRRVLAQFRNCFIVAEDREGLLLVDQHVAHERLLYERLRAQLEEGPVPRQAALFPVVLEPGPELVERAREHRERLERCGFVIEDFGVQALRVLEVPAVMGRKTAAEGVLAVLEELGRASRRPAEGLFEHLLATVACHSAVRKGQALTPEKMEYLLQGLDACEAPHHCPHGRVVSLRIDLGPLERAFGRS